MLQSYSLLMPFAITSEKPFRNIKLCSADESHPSIAGTGAAACCFYAAVFRKDLTLFPFNSLSLTINHQPNGGVTFEIYSVFGKQIKIGTLATSIENN